MYVLHILTLLHNKSTQINVNFLPVGHTHEDVDQFFSRVAAQLRKSGAESIPGELIHAYVQCLMQLVPTLRYVI